MSQLPVDYEGTRDVYPGLAKVMGPHNDLALYRKFADLNARNLLYMQAEIMLLERELWTIAFVDQHSKDADRESYSQRAEKMIRSSGGDGGRQWDKVIEIREKLKGYSKYSRMRLHGRNAEVVVDEALLQQAEINKLEKAQKQDLEVLQDWLRRPEGGNNFLQSFEDRPWSDDTDDLVALGGIGSDIDAVTKWTVSRAIPWLNQHGMHRLKVSGVWYPACSLESQQSTLALCRCS